MISWFLSRALSASHDPPPTSFSFPAFPAQYCLSQMQPSPVGFHRHFQPPSSFQSGSFESLRTPRSIDKTNIERGPWKQAKVDHESSLLRAMASSAHCTCPRLLCACVGNGDVAPNVQGDGVCQAVCLELCSFHSRSFSHVPQQLRRSRTLVFTASRCAATPA